MLMFGNQSDKKVEVLSVIREEEEEGEGEKTACSCCQLFLEFRK